MTATNIAPVQQQQPPPSAPSNGDSITATTTTTTNIDPNLAAIAAIPVDAIPIPVPLYSLFCNVNIFWNQTTIFNSNFMYPWYANFIMNMKMPPYERKVIYDTTMFYSDSRDLKDDWLVTKDGHSHLKKKTGWGVIPYWDERIEEFQDSNFVQVIGPLLHDLQFQSKLLRDDVSI